MDWHIYIILIIFLFFLAGGPYSYNILYCVFTHMIWYTSWWSLSAIQDAEAILHVHPAIEEMYVLHHDRLMILPPKLTYPLNNSGWKTIFLLKLSLLRWHFFVFLVAWSIHVLLFACQIATPQQSPLKHIGFRAHKLWDQYTIYSAGGFGLTSKDSRIVICTLFRR